MGFFKKMDTVFKSSESFRLMERTEVDLKIEADIVAYGIKKFAVSDYGDLYLKIAELGGFIMLETIIVSDTNLKSKKGTTLSFLKENQILTLESDEHIIESDFSNTVKKRLLRLIIIYQKKTQQFLQKKNMIACSLKLTERSFCFLL
jgi:hypothetical protein